MNITPARIRHLRWIEARQPVGAFTADGPSLSFVRRLEKEGLIEQSGKERGPFGLVLYSLTDAGRSALEAIGEKE